MEEENKKKRKAAKRARIDEVCALVQFVKRRDPRVTQQMERMVQEQYEKEEEEKREAIRWKEEIAAAKEVGRQFLFVDVCLDFLSSCQEFNIATLSQKHPT